jgi:hypothetical protein
VQVFGFEPRAKTGIVDFRVAVPKVGRQRALDLQMVKMQFDLGGMPGKMALHVARAHMKPGYAPGLSLRLDNHLHPF